MWTFLNQGIDPNARNAAGMTPLFYVRSKPVAKMLLDEGASPAARDNEGRTALMAASMGDRATGNRLSVARQLLAAGADPALRDKGGETAADHAAKKGPRRRH